jgi:hypothetical protein
LTTTAPYQPGLPSLPHGIFPCRRRPHNGSTLSDQAMAQPDAWRMIRWRLAVIGTA